METHKSKTTKQKSKTKPKIDQNIIDEFLNDKDHFVKQYDIKILIKLIELASDKYTNDQPIMTDKQYDFLFDYVKKLDPENKVLKKIGAPVMSKQKIELPYYMGSMDKIKSNDLSGLNKWLSKYNGPYVYSDKLDGVSGLLIFSDSKLSLYTRGDGIEGTDITKLIKYIPTINNLDLKKLSNNLAVRGELIISKNKFKKYQEKMANARNMVAGIVNSKTVDIDVVQDVDFVVYELINPWNTNQTEQWNILKNLGFNVVNYDNIEINFENLSNVLAKRKENSEYEIDGIIISNNELPEKRSINDNPDYAFAYKDIEQFAKAEAEVMNVEWSISKDGYIKPVLILQPTHIGGVIVSRVTAFNAKYIKDNILGQGAVIELIRSGDVIPYIQKIIKPAISGKPQLPINIEYEWSVTGVDIKATKIEIEQQMSQMLYFFKKLDIKNVSEMTVKKMFDVGITTIPQIFNITKEDLATVEGFGEKMVDKIYENIHNRIDSLNMLDLMVASNAFGHGLGDRKLRKVMEKYPDIIQLYTDNTDEDMINKIIDIEGFDKKTAEYFVNGLNRFIDLFNSLDPEMRKKLRISLTTFIEVQEIVNEAKQMENNKFAGKKFVFSGFRNKSWEDIIIKNGGSVSSSVSSNTDLLVTTSEAIKEGTNAKVVKAKELNKKILTKEEFEQEYIN